MDRNRKLALAATVAAFAIAPLTFAGAADAATSYSVSVLHCGGGIHAKAYPTHAKALQANRKAIAFQRNHPATLHTVQLRHGSKLLKSSTRPC